MPELLVINTHLRENPEFVGQLTRFIASLGVASRVVSGYDGSNPLHYNPSRIILSGVPIDAHYSLAQEETQRVVDRAFGWLPEATCPVLGICYGHQILAHAFGGAVSTLPQMVRDERLPLAWQAHETGGILPRAMHLRAFAEHRDVVSQVPEGFEVLCRVGPVPYVMVHRQRAFVGLQFVPEQSDAAGRQLLKRFVGAA